MYTRKREFHLGLCSDSAFDSLLMEIHSNSFHISHLPDLILDGISSISRNVSETWNSFAISKHAYRRLLRSSLTPRRERLMNGQGLRAICSPFVGRLLLTFVIWTFTIIHQARRKAFNFFYFSLIQLTRVFKAKGHSRWTNHQSHFHVKSETRSKTRDEITASFSPKLTHYFLSNWHTLKSRAFSSKCLSNRRLNSFCRLYLLSIFWLRLLRNDWRG